MLVVAIIYSLTSVIGKAAVVYVEPISFGAFYFVVLGAATLLLAALWQPAGLRVLTRNSSWHLTIGVLMAAMVITHFLAIAKITAAYMITVKRLSLLFGIFFGAWLEHLQP